MCAIEFGDLANLNKATHPSIEKRKFEDIKKYVDNSNPYLDQLISFLKKLPDLSEYINLEVTFFLNKSKKLKKNMILLIFMILFLLIKI